MVKSIGIVGHWGVGYLARCAPPAQSAPTPGRQADQYTDPGVDAERWRIGSGGGRATCLLPRWGLETGCRIHALGLVVNCIF